jgi:hypothetical protein
MGKQHRRPYPGLEGHQDCGVCHDVKPPNKKRERQQARREIEMSTPKLTKVFESVFHGQVYELNGKGYDVPKLTYWAEANVPETAIPLKDLTMSKSDEKHGTKEFKKHAKKVDHKGFPIVCVQRADGKIQIADGNHRAWKAAEAGDEMIQGYVVPEDQLPDEALAETDDAD